MKRLAYLLKQTELHVLLFVLGSVSLNWPILDVFQGRDPQEVVTYCFVIWGICIAVLFLVSLGCTIASREDSNNGAL